jgi:hypothetical protein
MNMADEMVMVSLLGKRSYRPGKGQPTINYKPGIVSMPVSYARTMGLMHRIVKTVAYEAGEAPVAVRVPFEGRFNEKLTGILTGAGYNSLDDLTKASRDELLALEGIGPAAYEQIQAAVNEPG